MKRSEAFCLMCGSRFHTTAARKRQDRDKCCSRKCRDAYHSLKQNLLQTYRQTGICLNCGKPIMSPKYGRERVDYCCQHCRSVHQWQIIKASGWTNRGKAA